MELPFLKLFYSKLNLIREAIYLLRRKEREGDVVVGGDHRGREMPSWGRGVRIEIGRRELLGLGDGR